MGGPQRSARGVTAQARLGAARIDDTGCRIPVTPDGHCRRGRSAPERRALDERQQCRPARQTPHLRSRRVRHARWRRTWRAGESVPAVPADALAALQRRPAFRAGCHGAGRGWQCSAAGSPDGTRHTVAPPDTGPSNAWSRVVASRGRSPATARKISAARRVSHTISTGSGHPSSASRR